MTSTTPVRHLQLGGSFNFRDIGGYETVDGATTRWQRLYRSDALNRLTPEDLEVLSDIGLATLFDLRSNVEVAEHGPGLPVEHHGARHVHIPFSEDVEATIDEITEITELGPVYVAFLERSLAPIRMLFEELANESGYPAVIHCAAGKDRTGVSIALVLRSLGVPDDVIAEDYGLTDPLMDIFISNLRAADKSNFIDKVHPELLRARPATIRYFLDHLDSEFGSTDGFLTETGVHQDTVDAIRGHLLDGRSSR